MVLCLSVVLQAQISKTITNLTPGGLITQMTSAELTTITNLILSGTIDARDIKTMKQTMTKLAVVDLSNTTIAAINESTYFPANTIPYAAFDGKISLTSVILPALITSIDIYAFNNCINLISVNMPSSVTTVGDAAFYGCSGLKSIILSNSLTTIGTAAFTDCKGLTSIDLPNAVTFIGNSAFYGCSGLTSVTFPNSLTTIEEGAFKNCSNLTSVILPNFLKTIGTSAFADCKGLTLIDFPISLTSMGNGTFSGCSSLTSVTLPNSITTISNGLFAQCSSLTSIILPASVTSIGQNAFTNCNQLASICAYPSTPVVLSSSNVFDGVNKNTCTLNVPSESLDLYKAADVWKDFAKIGIITSTGKEIKNDAITVSPNPAKEVITIHAQKGVVYIYNSNGELLITQSLEKNKQVNIRSLQSGIYLVVVNGESFKIIKE